jgi:pre-rRNA-processing protein TSR2
MLEDALQTDFNVQAEDDSPYQVSRSLVNMHNQVASGDHSYVESLRHLQPISAAVCQKESGPPDPEADSSSSSDEDQEGGMKGDGADAAGPDDMDTDDGPLAGNQPEGAQNRPLIDEDGFELVQRKGKGRR